MDLLPLSYINQYAYCPRRFWYMYVQAEMIENAHVLRGVINHENVNAPGYATDTEGVVLRRRVYVYSHMLGVSGICDLVEEHPDGRLVPVEYKQGQQGKWGNDQAQLCAQALCLEEMTGRPIDAGSIFYFGSRAARGGDLHASAARPHPRSDPADAVLPWPWSSCRPIPTTGHAATAAASTTSVCRGKRR